MLSRMRGAASSRLADSTRARVAACWASRRRHASVRSAKSCSRRRCASLSASAFCALCSCTRLRSTMAYLRADSVHHGQERRVGLGDLGAEELHYADETAGCGDGEAERAVQPDLPCRRKPREVRVLLHVRDPRGLSARPDPAGQAHAGGKREALAHGGEVRQLHGRGMPDVTAPQDPLLAVDGP